MSRAVAINGFGRIGRLAFRAAIENNLDIEFVAVNDIADAKTLAHLLKYDSTYGKAPFDVRVEGDYIVAGGVKVRALKEAEPSKLPWKDLDVYLVIESTGRFTDRVGASKHLQAGASKVLVSAPMRPAEAADVTIVPGVNDNMYDPKKHVLLSLASCTTNAVAPVAKVLNESFGLRYGLMNTVHAVTNDQRILDMQHSDLRRARSASWNIVPTTTGAAEAATLTLPELKGRMTGIALRVPVPTVSVVDLTAILERDASVDEVNEAFKEASEKPPLKGILGYSEEPLVSSDYIKCPYSSVVDAPMTKAIGNLVKVLAWYDNEWGYSCRLAETAKRIADIG
ncbi:MAG: type I glyceraldehyde-3-phosphate dehydrogenase [Candidatus Bathyarchaeota archaeon]|nr:type I glyceraldehyde-3-phosphate dehydrogenase [Candidatus Bathyarchaeota archaeon]